MKRSFLSLAILVATCMAHGSAQEKSRESDFYPLKVGHTWRYRSINVKSTDANTDPLAKQDESKRRFARVEIKVDRIENFERPKDKDKKDTVEKIPGFLIKSTSGGKTTFDHVVVLDDGVHRISVGGTSNTPPVPITPPLLFLKLQKTWDVNSKSGNTDIKGTFKAEQAPVKVPFGEFKDAVKISYRDGPENSSRIEIDYWFARDVGMVKQRIKAKNHETILELESFDAAK